MVLTSPVTRQIPIGSVIVGECWAQIVANGESYSDADSPYTMVQVGDWGEKGSVEIQDLVFTTKGPTPGAVLMEWNMAEDLQGSAAMWDSHFRIGGAMGTGLTAADCPKLTGTINPKCVAGSMLLHMTGGSSGYLENVWAWVADHDFDSGPAQTQIDIYVARGILIESKGGPVWLYGTASEHCVFYQYLLLEAQDVFMGNVSAGVWTKSSKPFLLSLETRRPNNDVEPDSNRKPVLPAKAQGACPVHGPGRALQRGSRLQRVPRVGAALRSCLGIDDFRVNQRSYLWRGVV